LEKEALKSFEILLIFSTIMHHLFPVEVVLIPTKNI